MGAANLEEADAAWASAWHSLGVAEPPGLRDRLVVAHAEPTRAYHTGRHLAECFAHFARVRDRLDRPAEVALALWFHDAVYDPRRSDNEDQSAAWATRELGAAGIEAGAIGRVVASIGATRHDAPAPPGDAATLVDIDLAILGAPAERFDEYEREVRAEYAFVPEADFRAARARILRAFLDRSNLYATLDFRSRFEAAARVNLAQSIGRLADRASGPTC